jgi:hypothetical protein
MPAPPTGPTPNRSIAGSWSGSYFAACPSYVNCGFVAGPPTSLSDPQPMNLAVNQHGEGLDGQINLSGWLGNVATVTGSVAPDGSMTMQGGDSWPRSGFCRPAGGWNILSWNARYDAPTDQITGTFTYTTQKHLSSCYYLQDLIVNATNVVLRRGGATDSSFAGHWQGTYHVVKCTPVLWTTCFTPDYDPPFNLQLSQSGTTATGELTHIPYGNSTPLPVSGTAASPTKLDLSGVRTQGIGVGTQTYRLTGWNVTRDNVGRMSGTFSYIDEVQWTGGPNAGTTWSMSYDAELKYVVRVPW